MNDPFPELDLDVVDPPAERAGRAELTNMRLALATMYAAQNAGEGSPRLSVFYGHSGYGKSVAAAYVAARVQAVYVEAKSIWTQRSILEAIAGELGIAKMERTSPRLLQQVVDAFASDPCPLIIDEMDHLVKKQMVEIIRDIHDATRIPIMMIGEEALPAKLRAWERFDNRIIASTAAQPASADDVRKLREHFCLRVRIEDDLLTHIAERSHSVTRRIVVNLRKVQNDALDDGVTTVDRAWWGDRPLMTGDLPSRRRAA